MQPEDDGDNYSRQPGDRNLPVPDPTRLTTQLVDRALSSYREVVETRLSGMDQATKLVAADIARIAAITESSTAHLREDVDRQIAGQREYVIAYVDRVADVSGEKFTAIDTRFLERDTRTEQAAQESRISLDAALAAAKEAVSEQNKANTLAIDKSGTAIQKQLDAMQALMATSNRSLEDKISDLKTRLDRGEGHDTGTASGKTERRLDVNLVIGIGLALIALITFLGLRP